MSMHSDGMSPEERAYLEFLRDEGLELLALYKRIESRSDRDKVRELARSLATRRPETSANQTDSR